MSSTSTTRLGMNKPTPGTGEAVNVATQLNANWDKIDASVGATICTSGTRPGSPWDGQIIRETDTRNVYIRNNFQGAWDLIYGGGGATTYTPVWTCVSGGQTTGNATLAGRYSIVGKWMDFNIRFVWGSSTVNGSGVWRFTLPVTPVAGGIFNAYFADSSSGTRWGGSGRITAASTTGDNMRIILVANTGGIGGSTPVAFAVDDELVIGGRIEVA